MSSINLAKFYNPYEKKKHFQKHVIDQKELFPIIPKNENQYELLANDDLNDFTYLFISDDYNYERKFSYIKLFKETTTLTITNNRNNSKILLTYFVPQVTLIPEYLFFSHLFKRNSAELFSNNPLESILFEKFKSLNGYLTWAKEVFTDFIVLTGDLKKQTTLNLVIFFINQRTNSIRYSTYNSFNLFLLKILKQFSQSPNSKVILKNDQFLIDKLSDYIRFSDNQLIAHFKTTQPEKTTYLIFVLAYLNWLYNLLESTVPIKLNSISDLAINKVFTMYAQIFNLVQNSLD
jgi:hypothetical protein